MIGTGQSLGSRRQWLRALQADPRAWSSSGGLTLLELLLAVALGSGLALLMLQVLLGDGLRLQRLAQRLRQTQLQRRTIELVLAEVRRAERVSPRPEMETHACSLAGRRPVLHLTMADGTAVTYSVGAAPSAIWRAQVLMRCGPAFALDGQPSGGSALNRVVLDGLERPASSWQQCGDLLGSAEGAAPLVLNASAGEPFAACWAADRGLLAVRLVLGPKGLEAEAVTAAAPG